MAKDVVIDTSTGVLYVYNGLNYVDGLGEFAPLGHNLRVIDRATYMNGATTKGARLIRGAVFDSLQRRKEG